MAKTPDPELPDYYTTKERLVDLIEVKTSRLSSNSRSVFLDSKVGHQIILKDLTDGIQSCRSEVFSMQRWVFNVGLLVIFSLIISWPGVLLAGWFTLGLAFLGWFLVKNFIGVKKSLSLLEERIKYPVDELSRYTYISLLLTDRLHEALDALEEHETPSDFDRS